MANIRKVPGKTGVSYKITVTHGVDMSGKQLRHYKTWAPPPGMTEKRAAKEAEKVAIEFEQQIEQGFALDNRQTFAEYARYVIDLKKRAGIKRSTIERYESLLPRLDASIGSIKLAELRPQHLNSIYKMLAEEGIRETSAKATPKPRLQEVISERKISGLKLSQLAGISPATVRAALKPHSINAEKAEAISDALGEQVDTLFSIVKDETPLSGKTVAKYHLFISTVLKQAEKEMLVLFNAASRATPPKQINKQVNYFQPQQVAQILAALDSEPIKWRTITLMLIVTGCRRSELAGLKWQKVDFTNRQIRVDGILLHSRDIGLYESTTKTDNIRFIKLPAETIEMLKQYRKYQIGLRLANGDRWKETDYIFTRDDGSPMNPDSITKWLNTFSKRHELPHINPHAFRHTMASVLISSGKDVVSVSKRLGHAKVSTTTDIYSHIIHQADEQSSECIADTLLRVGKKKQA